MGGSSRGQGDLRQMFLIGEIFRSTEKPWIQMILQESLQSGPNFFISCKPHKNKECIWFFLTLYQLHGAETCCYCLLFSCQVMSNSFANPQTVALQAPLSMGLSQQYWCGFPCPPPGDLPNPGIEPTSPAPAGRFFTTEPPSRHLINDYWTLERHPGLISNTHTLQPPPRPVSHQ